MVLLRHLVACCCSQNKVLYILAFGGHPLQLSAPGGSPKIRLGSEQDSWIYRHLTQLCINSFANYKIETMREKVSSLEDQSRKFNIQLTDTSERENGENEGEKTTK